MKLFIFLYCFVAVLSYASNLSSSTSFFNEDYEEKKWNPFVSIALGAPFISVKKSSASESSDSILTMLHTDLLINSRQSDLVDIFAGVEWGGYASMPIQMGLNFNQFLLSHLLEVSVETPNRLDDYNDKDEYWNYIRQLLVQGKIFFNGEGQFHPYCLIGLGGAFKNDNFGKQSTFKLFNVIVDSPKSCFSYALGAGFDYDINHNIRLGLGYRFADLDGTFNVGKIKDLELRKLFENKLYSHQIIIQFIYLFN